MADIVTVSEKLLSAAARAKASDVYIEALDSATCRIRVRVSGELRTVKAISPAEYASLITRFKTLAGMDISKRLIAQDGAFIFYTADHTEVNVRVASVPAATGEHLVLRLFDKTLYTRDFHALGMKTDDVAKLRRLMARRDGLILVTGPTGAGKSSTCYAMLNQLNDDRRHIVTLEDPVEVQLPGVTQISVNEKQNITFDTGLRAVLRQDPDVIMIGEIRDDAAAQAAVQAALTGHLVLSTMHTKNVAATLARFAHFDIHPDDIKAALIGVVSQYLVRLKGKGRTGVFEVAEFTGRKESNFQKVAESKTDYQKDE